MIHNVLVKERTKDNEFAAAMMLGLNVSEGAKALSRIMKLQCVDFVAFMQKFILCPQNEHRFVAFKPRYTV